jgi:hypothetical protein
MLILKIMQLWLAASLAPAIIVGWAFWLGTHDPKNP